MGYLIEDCTSDPALLDEVADFLAAFTEDGEGPSQMPADCLPAQWKKRFQWWWSHNPYCHEESPRGLILRDDQGLIVGFFGLIPHDYSVEGERVPSLIYAATYVRQASREAALGLWMRAHRLRNNFHLVDGGPSVEVQELLSKTGYSRAEPARLHFFPVRKRLNNLRHFALRLTRIVAPRKGPHDPSLRIVSSLDQVKTVPAPTGQAVRKHTDIDSIRWYLQSGSTPRYFLGWVDEAGTLQAYLIGTVRKKKKFNVQLFTLVDADCFHPSGDDLVQDLVSYAARHPEEAGLPGEAEVIVLPLAPSSSLGNRLGSVEARYRVFYHLPRPFADATRLCRPWEGDIFSY